jgi:SprT protein
MSIAMLQQQCLNEVEQMYSTAEQYFSRKFTRVPVIFSNHMKRMAGKATGYRTGKPLKLTFSNVVLGLNENEFIEQTVPHEVAHLIGLEHFGKLDHGPEWSLIMTKVFERKDDTYHKYKTPGFIYKTGAGVEMIVSNIQHRNMTLKHAAYRLRDGSLLTKVHFTGKQIK